MRLRISVLLGAVAERVSVSPIFETLTRSATGLSKNQRAKHSPSMKRILPAIALAATTSAAASLTPLIAATSAPVDIRWLDGAPPAALAGVAWGVPFARGTVAKEQTFALKAANGAELPLQSWPLAYWPDGSMKWIGFATVAGSEAGGPLTLASAASATTAAPKAQVTVSESNTVYVVDTGVLQARIVKWGGALIESLRVDGREVARDGRLVCVLQRGPDGEPADAPPREHYTGKIESVTVEQRGPVRAVVRVEGRHRGAHSSREWLPFVVRLYFHAGTTEVRVVHTITYDGNEQVDFIRGLGLRFAVPMREEIQNRHVWFSGEDDGLWGEPIQPMVGRGAFIARAGGEGRDNAFPDQVAGLRVPNRAQMNERETALLDNWAVWSDFKLSQPTDAGFSIVKRTNPQSAWIPAGAGRRASGLVFAGDASGSLGVAVRNFWQSHPTALEVRDAAANAAELTAWLWSPESPAMDMRHYDTRAHGLDAVYEDVQPGLSTPLGVARTSELVLHPRAAMPTRAEAVALARAAAQPPRLLATPEYLHSLRAFGIWSLPDRSTPFKKAIEDQLDASLAYYQKSVEQRRWYGFWDFGDFMHSYDPVRHVWRYDLGGMAWDNTELGTDLWLWTSFLRSGRADLFRLAEAMTRHTSEVDVYHLGPLAGLGSRHNVRHWGCGAKEARISMATLKRPYYYLTTDERTGDLMRAVVNVDHKALEFDSMRLAQPITEAEKKYPARVRAGPDWLAFVANWMTEWERTGDVKWRAKIDTGVASFLAMPFWMRSGKNLVYGYDPATGRLFQVSEGPGTYNLATIQAGAEAVFELNDFYDNADWMKMWMQYCRLGSASAEVIQRDKETGKEGADATLIGEQGGPSSQGTPRLAAYVYRRTGNKAFAEKAIEGGLRRFAVPFETRSVTGAASLNPLEEAVRVSTNDAAQSALTAIEILELCGDVLPAEVPPPPPTRSPGGRRPPGGG
jgi:hypothetical protein